MYNFLMGKEYPPNLYETIVRPEVSKSPHSKYFLPEKGVQEITTIVNNSITAGKREGEFLSFPEIEHHSSIPVELNKMMDNLPEGMSEDDLGQILFLALKTECGTKLYADAIKAAGVNWKQPWLVDYVENFWTPDENMHHTPYKMLLLNLGYSEAELDHEIAETRAAEFVHGEGESPAYVSTFGIVQELLTQNYHGKIAGVLKPHAPGASHLVSRITAREGVHRTQYARLTSVQISHNPANIRDAAKALAEFTLPGKYVAPKQQEHATRYTQLIGTDPEKLIRSVGKTLHEVTNDPGVTGQIALEVAIRREKLPIPGLDKVNKESVVSMLRGLGHLGASRVIGEAALESIGLDLPSTGRHTGLRGIVEDVLRPHLVKGFKNMQLIG